MFRIALAAAGLLASFSGFAGVGAAPTALEARAPTVCNGYAALCNRSYSNVTFIGSHDSYAVSTSSLVLSANQEVSVAAQLALGARLLQSQAHMSLIGNVIHLCHTSCFLFDGGTLLAYLQTVKTFLDANPNEVVTLVVTNPDNISVSQYWAPTFVSSGIVPYAYVPPSATPNGPGLNGWPTLSSMISSGKRLVVFMDYNNNITAAPYILPEFNNIWEDPYDVTDASFPCSVDRGSSPNMFMMNHFRDNDIASIDVPDKSDAATTNSIANIQANAAGCASLNTGRNPTFVLLDFIDLGQGVAAGAVLNGV